MPAIVAGPLVRRGAVVSTPFEHVSIAATLKTRFGIASLGRRMDAANDLSSLPRSERAVVGPAPVLPTVALSESRMLRVAAARDQPAGDARAGGRGRHARAATSTRARARSASSWLRHAQELESVRVIA